jgi:hypothetical protein
MTQHGVSLSRAIGLLRSELEQALDEGADDRLRFSLDAITLDLEVTVDETEDRWRVTSAGDGTRGHRMTLVLRPHDMALGPQRGETLIGDSDDLRERR